MMNFLELLKFLKGLSRQNTKEWFDLHRKEYEGLRREWIDFVQEIINQLQVIDPSIAGLEAKHCIFRINRDVRFSANKSPYKNNFGASFNKGGKNSGAAGYYLHIQPGECFIAGGLYAPEADALNKVRQEIDYNLEEFKSLITAKDFKKQFGLLTGEKLIRPPKGYEADNPAIDYIKHKSFLMYREFDESLLTGKGTNKFILDGFKAMTPLIHFLNRGL